MKDKTEINSPDRKFKLIFDSFEEPRMGLNISKFSLTEIESRKTISFVPVWAIGWEGQSVSWSENGNYFSLPLESPSDCFFIYDIDKRQFTSIHFTNCWVLEGRCNNDYIEIEFRDDQIPERNEHNKYPTKIFLKPPNLRFEFSELSWANIKSIQQFQEINKNVVVHNFQPIDNGWRQLRGQLPQTTEILVSHLFEFAKYGDNQSKEWFNEIQSKTIDINYWINASHYLGQRNRK